MPKNRFNNSASVWGLVLCLVLAPSAGLSQTESKEPARPVSKPTPSESKTTETAVKAPAVNAPTVKTQAVQTPTVKVPTSQAPVVKAPAPKAPEVKAPTVKAPAVKDPAVKAPPVKLPPKPELRAPIRSAVNWAEALEASAPEPVQKAKTQIQSRQAVDPRTKLKQSGEKARENLRAAPALAPKALDATRLPVLLPSDPVQKAKAKMVSFGEAYSIAIPPKDGLSIAYSGTTSFAPLPKAKSDQLKAERSRPVAKSLANSGLPDDLKITRTEDGWTASFTRFGVLYSVDILCDDLDAPNCKDDKVIRKAVEDLRDVVLGQAARAEAEAALLPRPAAAPTVKGQ